MSRMKQNKNESIEGANSDQQAWDIAVKCLQKGDSDVEAMTEVYEALKAPASIDYLAIIMAAVYADTYWTGTKMDPHRLSSSLQNNGWDKADSDRAAKEAFSQWRGLLARCSLGDSGLIPRKVSTRNSPDAISDGNNVLSHADMLNHWNSYFFDFPYTGKNNIYGRAQSFNMDVTINTAKASMYVYSASLNIPPPAKWQRLHTPDNSDTTPLYGMEDQPVAPGERVASDGFIWDNKGSISYCIVHCPSTEFFTNDPTTVPARNWDLNEWLTCNGAGGLHNIALFPFSKGEDSLRFFNHDGIPEKFIFEAHCSKLPDGTEVTLECDDRDLPNEIMTRPMKTSSRYHLISTPLVELPAYFEGELSVRIKTPGNNPLPEDASVEVRMIWILRHGHPHYEQAVELLGAYSDGAAHRPVRLQIGNFTFVGKND